MKITVLFTTFAFVFTATFSLAHAQTKDAIAIRKVLEDEKIGWKRGDIEKITEHYQPHFTGYDGVEKADPREWRILFSDLDEFKDYLEERFSKVEYDLKRTATKTEARNNRAYVVTQEQGKTTHKETEMPREFDHFNFWMLEKVDNEWKITGFVFKFAVPE